MLFRLVARIDVVETAQTPALPADGDGMASRAQTTNQNTSTAFGASLLLAGLLMFLLIFIALYPVVRNPVNTYDRWFPTDEATEQPTIAPPQAAFSWESNTTAPDDATGVVRFADQSTRSASSIVEWIWEFGDGATASGQQVDHQYASAGNYVVGLTVTAADGTRDSVQGRVPVREFSPTLGDIGRISEFLDIGGLGDVQGALGGLGDSLTDPISTVVDSVGDTARGGVVVALFALAALGAMMVAWRVARIGAMLLLGAVPREGRFLRNRDYPEELRLVESDQ